MTDLLILPRIEPVDATVTVPGSKSLTNRALLAAALAPGRSTLVGALDAEDTRIMAEALGQIGINADLTDFSFEYIAFSSNAEAPMQHTENSILKEASRSINNLNFLRTTLPRQIPICFIISISYTILSLEKAISGVFK